MGLEDDHCGPSKEKLRLVLSPHWEMLHGTQQEEGVGGRDRVRVFFDSLNVPFVSCSLYLSVGPCIVRQTENLVPRRGLRGQFQPRELPPQGLERLQSSQCHLVKDLLKLLLVPVVVVSLLLHLRVEFLVHCLPWR